MAQDKSKSRRNHVVKKSRVNRASQAGESVEQSSKKHLLAGHEGLQDLNPRSHFNHTHEGRKSLPPHKRPALLAHHHEVEKPSGTPGVLIQQQPYVHPRPDRRRG